MQIVTTIFFVLDICNSIVLVALVWYLYANSFHLGVEEGSKDLGVQKLYKNNPSTKNSVVRKNENLKMKESRHLRFKFG